MRRFLPVLVLALLAVLALSPVASADDGARPQAQQDFPVLELLSQNTCFDVSRYEGYIWGAYYGPSIARATLKIERARDGWWYDGSTFTPYPVEIPVGLGYRWDYPFKPDYGLYYVTLQVVTTSGYRAEAQANLALRVRTQEFVYQSSRNGNTDIYRAENRAFAVGEVRLTDNAAYDGAPVFSPDHKWIAFESNRDGNFEIYVMDAAYGKTLYRLTNDPADDRAPTWSPDGKFIAFHSNRDGHYQVYATGFPYGRDLYKLTTGTSDSMYPAWSPDYRYLAFQSNREGGKFQIFETTFPYGRSTYRLGRFSGAVDTTPSFSPDGKFIAFSSTRNGNSDIYFIDSDYGNSVYQVTRSTANETNPVWTPFCDSLYYQSESGGTTAIFQAYNPFYGTDNRRVTLDPVSNLLRGLNLP